MLACGVNPHSNAAMPALPRTRAVALAAGLGTGVQVGAAMVATRFAPRDLPPIALLGIGQFGILVALLNVGLRTVPAGQAAIIFATFPLQTMLLAALLGHEKLSARKSAGAALLGEPATPLALLGLATVTGALGLAVRG